MASLTLLRRLTTFSVVKGVNICTNVTHQVRTLSMPADWESTHFAQGSSKPVIDEDKITLFNMRFCPFAERTVLVLLAKNIPFVNINIDLKNKPDWFLDGTFGKVPVLLYKGKKIPESLITSDLLDEMYPTPKLHPSCPIQKALDKTLVEKQSMMKMMKALYPMLYKLPNLDVTNEDKVELFKIVAEKLISFEDELKARNTKYLGGEQPSMVDYMVWPTLERIQGLPIFLSEISESVTIPSHLVHVLAWIKSMRETEPVKQYGISPNRMAKISQLHIETGGYDAAVNGSAGL